MDSRVEQLQKQADKLFEQKRPVDALWQEIAEYFYPQRADFTSQRNIGREYASHLSNGYTLLVHRDLTNAISALARPTSSEWAKMGVGSEVGQEGKAWLQWATGVQRRAMYDREAQLVRATKEADADWTCFGQAAISTEVVNRTTLLYRTKHLRDLAWSDNYNGTPRAYFEKIKIYACDLVRMFPNTVTAKIKARAAKEPYCEMRCMRAVLMAEDYSATRFRTPWASIYWECESGTVLEEIGSWTKVYTLPRWQTVSGSQYACSPATMIGLPDARLLQTMTYTLLRAGEKYVDPPLIARSSSIRNDIVVYPGAINHVDGDYDEKLGEVLRPLGQDKSGFPIGLQMMTDTKQLLAMGHFLDKLNPPVTGEQMTAYEFGRRWAQYVQQIMPLFEPLEYDYSGDLCEQTFELMLHNNAFGNMADLPRELRGQEIKFTFSSPMNDAIEQTKSNQFLQLKQLLAEAVAVDPDAVHVVDIKGAFRDAALATAPAKWINSEAAVKEMSDAANQQREAQQLLQAGQQSSQIVKNLGSVAQAA